MSSRHTTSQAVHRESRKATKSRRSCAYARTEFGDLSIAVQVSKEPINAIHDLAVTHNGRGLHTRRHQHTLHPNHRRHRHGKITRPRQDNMKARRTVTDVQDDRHEMVR
jgi:hypothetical protein